MRTGTTRSGSFNVTVADTTPPTLKLPGALAVEATSPTGASVAYTASAVDTVSGTLTPACTRQPGLFPFGPTDVTCTATDAHGNHSSGTFTVTVADTTPPALKLPGTITAEATSRTGAAVTISVPAVDAVSGSVSATCTPQLDVFPLGQTSVTCTAQDARGNRAYGSFTVNVVDTTPPRLIIPGDFTIAAGFDSSRDAYGATLNFAPRAVDIVDLKLPVSCSPASGTFIPVRRRLEPVAVTVKCTAVDSHGNEATGGFTVTITTG